VVDPDSGTFVTKLSIGQPISGGPLVSEKRLIVAAIDGSLYHIESAFESKSAP
jgi:hypothetical protein